MVICGKLSDHSLGFLKSTIPTQSFQSLALLPPLHPKASIVGGGRDMHFGTEKGDDLAKVYGMEGTWPCL